MGMCSKKQNCPYIQTEEIIGEKMIFSMQNNLFLKKFQEQFAVLLC